MAVYQLTSPQGQQYEVTAPDDASQDQVMAYFRNSTAVDGVPQESPSAAAPVTSGPPETMGDRARLLFDQSSQGVPFVGTFTDEAYDAAGALGAKVYDKTLGDDVLNGVSIPDLYRQARQGTTERLKQQQEAHPVASALAQLSGGIAAGGLGAATTEGKILADSLRSGNALSRIVKGIGAGGLSAGAYGAGAAEDGKALEGFKQALPVGAAVGGAIPAAGALLDYIKAPVRPEISDGKQFVANLAQKYNIPLGLDDLTDSKFYKTLISEGESIPLSGSAKHYDAQQRAFTNAVGKSIGVEDAKGLTPEVMSKAYENIGKQFDDLTKGKTFSFNDGVKERLAEIQEIADAGGFGEAGLRNYNKFLADLSAGRDQAGNVAGEVLSKQRAKLNRIGREASDQNVKELANKLESTISDFITSDAPEALQKAKYQYKNFLAIEPLAQKSQVDGFINPALLTGRVKDIYGREFTTGKAGELGDLARIGQLIKNTVPNSGTSQRTLARDILTGNVGNTTALAAGFINPAIPVAKLGLSGLSVLGNRGLQSRNYNPETIANALKNYAASRSVTPLALSSPLTNQLLKE